jgi:glycosyltransferase involved in cell wall biosynthesis
LKVGLFAAPLLEVVTGRERYAVELIGAMSKQRPGDAFVVYAGEQNHHLFVSARPNVSLQVVPRPGILGRRPTYVRFLRRELRRGSIDILHLLEGPTPLVSGARVVATVYDLAPILVASTFALRARLYYWWALRSASVGGGELLAISDAVASSLTSVLSISPQRITTTPLAPAEHFRPSPSHAVQRVRARYGLPGTYFIHTGTIEPRKNIVNLLKAFQAVSQHDRETALVFAGATGWKSDDVFATVDRLRLRTRTRFLGHVPDEDLAPLYSGAVALTYPSVMEGFGLPIIEAMSCGLPVICADRSPMKDIAQGAAILIDPSDPVVLAAAMLAVLLEQDLRHDLRSKALRLASGFTWATVGRRTWRGYERAAKAADEQR